MFLQLENDSPQGITNLWNKSPSSVSDNIYDKEAAKGPQVTSETKPLAVLTMVLVSVNLLL